MSCPECNQRTWKHDRNTIVCKNGHLTWLGNDKPEPEVTVLRQRPTLPLVALVAALTTGLIQGAIELL